MKASPGFSLNCRFQSIADVFPIEIIRFDLE